MLPATGDPLFDESYYRATAMATPPYETLSGDHHADLVVIGAGYTGLTAALRAAEMQCDALFKGTSVDGVYDADPKKVSTAKRYETLSYDRVLADNLKVMDASAVSLCRDNNIPIVVFSIRERGNILKVLDGSGTSTVVTSEGN